MVCVVEQELLIELKAKVKELEQKYGYTTPKVLEIMNKNTIPLSVFATNICPLRALVTYLHDYQEQSFSSIAKKLDRSYRAIWGAYHKEGIDITTSNYNIPIDCFNEKHSILESVVKQLREQEGMKFSIIAQLLNKDARTIWTVYKRAQKKDAT